MSVLTSSEEIPDQEYWIATKRLYSRYFNFNRIISILEKKKKDSVDCTCFEEVLVQNIFFCGDEKVPCSWKEIFEEIDSFYD